MFDNRVQKMSVRCPRTAGLSRAGAQPLADRCSVLTVEVEPPVPYLYHHKTFKCTHLLGQRAGLLGRVEDFVVEDGEVEGQAQPDGVCWLHVLLADVEGVLVSLLRVLHRVFTTQETQQSLFLLHETSYTKHSVTLHKDRLQDIMVNDIKGVKKSENIHIHEAGT